MDRQWLAHRDILAVCLFLMRDVPSRRAKKAPELQMRDKLEGSKLGVKRQSFKVTFFAHYVINLLASIYQKLWRYLFVRWSYWCWSGVQACQGGQWQWPTCFRMPLVFNVSLGFLGLILSLCALSESVIVSEFHFHLHCTNGSKYEVVGVQTSQILSSHTSLGTSDRAWPAMIKMDALSQQQERWWRNQQFHPAGPVSVVVSMRLSRFWESMCTVFVFFLSARSRWSTVLIVKCLSMFHCLVVKYYCMNSCQSGKNQALTCQNNQHGLLVALC